MMHEAAIALLTERLDEVQQNLKDNEVDGAEARCAADEWDDKRDALQKQADEILAAINTLEKEQ